jgi:hypothetical protein
MSRSDPQLCFAEWADKGNVVLVQSDPFVEFVKEQVPTISAIDENDFEFVFLSHSDQSVIFFQMLRKALFAERLAA